MYYVIDLERSQAEIVRLTLITYNTKRPADVGSRCTNQLVNLLNDICASLSAETTHVDHQDTLGVRVEANRNIPVCDFYKEDMAERVKKRSISWLACGSRKARITSR
jgi:hypothetical protein